MSVKYVVLRSHQWRFWPEGKADAWGTNLFDQCPARDHYNQIGSRGGGTIGNELVPMWHDLQCIPHQLHPQHLNRILTLLRLLRGVLPASMLSDQALEGIDCILRGDAPPHAIVTHIQVNLPNAAAYVAEVSICHLPWAVDDATHDCDPNTGKVSCSFLNLGRRLLEIEECPATRRATDELRLGDAHTRSLEQVEGRLAELISTHRACLPKQALTQAVHEEASKVG
mmetsp:Transcript_19816/g.49429  ORF Transcript_19816/g.49429 Transcript_19816/m.49429 type:complete len:226 (-) Transcript_19816:1960-2637(-)